MSSPPVLVLYDGDEDFILLYKEVVFSHQTCQTVLLPAGAVAVGQVGVTVAHLTSPNINTYTETKLISHLVTIIRYKKVSSGAKYRSTVGVVGDGEHFLLDVELGDVETSRAVESEEEGVVRGHVAALASRGS